MWDDVVIGTGHKGNSSVLFRRIGDDGLYISHNSVSYWISDAYLDTGLTIFKDTEQGKVLAIMLANNCSDKELEEWMDAVVIKHIPNEVLKSKIAAIKIESFESGREYQAACIRAALHFKA